MGRTTSHGKYLGLPSVSGRKKTEMFASIIDRIQSKVASWRSRLLSKGGREIMVKSVLQAIPSYTMSCFKFPCGVLDEITSIIRRFWWGSKEGESKINWVAWKKITQKKAQGGLGFRELESFNLALLAKQGWRLLTSPRSLLARVLKAKYFPHTSFFNAEIGSSPSFTWRGIFEAKQYLATGCGRVINSGYGTLMGVDSWIPGFASTDLINEGIHLDTSQHVALLINHDTHLWRHDLVAQIFPAHIAQAILSMPLGNTNLADKWKWSGSSTGRFTVKSAYDYIKASLHPADPIPDDRVPFQRAWKSLWSLKISPRIIHFIWRCCYGALPFADTLSRRGMTVDDSCPFCDLGPSNALHFFFHCSFATSLWTEAGLLQDINREQQPIAADWFSSLLMLAGFKSDLFAMLCYFMWYHRNKAIFDGIRTDEKIILTSALTVLKDFQDARGWPEQFHCSLAAKLWRKPPSQGFRIYFDGGLSHRPAGGVGLYVEDEHGLCVRAMAKFYEGVADPLAIELFALRDALISMQELQLQPVSIMGDCQMAILAAMGEEDVPSSCCSILDDIKNLLRAVPCLGIFWIRRSMNLVAHEIAFHAKNNPNCNESWSSIPDFLLSIRAG